MKATRGRRRRVVTVLASLLLTFLVGVGVASSYRNPLVVEFSPSDLYGVVAHDGVVQLFRGRQTVLKYGERRLNGQQVPDVVRVRWSEDSPSTASPGVRRPTLRTFRIAMSTWPPLTQTASILFGGQAMMPTADGGTSPANFGWQLDARGLSAWPLLALVATPTIVLAPSLLRRRGAPGTCPSCGYDLRASPGRCPECGRDAAGAAAAG